MNFSTIRNVISLFFVGVLAPLQGQINNMESDFYNTEEIQEIRIKFEENNWAYLLDSFKMRGNRILIGNVEINGKKLRDIGVRYSGGYAFRNS